MSFTHLCFDSYLGSQKPENIRNKLNPCPFCDREHLDRILDERGSILLIENKYPVLRDTFQTVLIETQQCDAELSTYSKQHLYQVIEFGIEHWQAMEQSGQYASVIFYKNHGPCSGGTIRHPHMQIVGLHHLDYRQALRPDYFEGLPVDRRGHTELNISTKPRIGLVEFNALLGSRDELTTLADYIQIAAHYALNGFNRYCTSYNLFFYEFNSRIICKIVPRFVTSPLFVGFSIPQVSNRIEEITQDLRKMYF